MKNRNTVIVAFLLVATMLLGIGYAELNDVLEINGTAAVSATAAEKVFDEDVYFSAVSDVTRTSTNTNISAGAATAEIDGSDSDKGTISIPDGVLMATGDKITVTYTIHNAGDLAASVAKPVISNDNELYFTVTTNWGDEAKNLASGANITVEVTIALVKTPVETQSAEFGISFNATSTDALS